MDKIKKPTIEQKRILSDLVDNRCEICDRHEVQCGKLIPHRINRGYLGGKYIPRNIEMICNDCHKKIHHSEFIRKV